MSFRKRVHVAVVVVAALSAAIGVRGQGGAADPILVVLNDSAPNPFGAYLPEILRAEGINTFDVVQLAALDAPTLGAARLVVLAETPLTAPQAALFTDYVTAGGRLVAMRPDPQLAGVLGIGFAGGTVGNGYVLVDQSGPGAGLQNLTLPFKGLADQYTLAGGTAVAELYSTRTLSANRPAVVKFGRTAAWSFDLARSTAYARQGDPAFAGLDRDGQTGYRTNDIFFQTVDLARVGVPHADVQMRLLSRVIADLLADSLPLPRLWYFPGASRTLMVLTGDSHTSTPAPYAALIAAVESVGARITLYLSRFLDLSGSPVSTWVANGHEVSVHPFFEPDGFAGNFPAGYTAAFDWFATGVPVPAGPTVRHHSLEWAGWIDPVSVMVGRGLRMDLSYYAWGPALDNPTLSAQAHGYLTGSGLPMRFVSSTGQVLPVYQQFTSLTDEQLLTGSYSQGLTTAQALAVSRQLIDDSQAGGYSAIATQFHVDYYQFGEVGPWVDGTLAYAANQQLAMRTSSRWLQYVEARATTTIADLTWTPGSGQLTFGITVPAGAEPQSVTLPQTFAGRVFAGLTVDGQTVAPTLQPVNGLATEFFSVAPLGGGGQRQVVVRYQTAATLPTISVGDVTVFEGDAGTTTASPVVTLSAASAADVTVAWTTVNGTATAGSDYVAASGTLTFTAGQTSLPLPITINGDTTDEAHETVQVTLSNPVGAAFGDASGTVTILDDESFPTSWVHSAAADFSSCSTPSGTRVGAVGNVRLLGTFRDDFAGAGLDPQWISGSWAGPPYTPVPSGGALSLGNADGAFVRSAIERATTTVEARARFTGAANQSIGLADDTFVGQYARFSTRSTTTNLWAVTNAGSGEIFTDLGPIPVSFRTFTIERLAAGPNEIVRYSVDGVVAAEHTVVAGGIPASRYLFLSHNGGATPTLDIDSVETDPPFAAAGSFDSCTIDAQFPVAWNQASWNATLPVTSTLALRTRTSADTVTWSPWSAPLTTSGSAITSPVGRYLQYRLELATSDSASGPIVHDVTITSVEPPPSVISIGNTAVTEGPGASAVFTVSLSAASVHTVRVAYATAGGSATSGTDFTGSSGTVTFLPGVTSQPVNVAVLNDALDEDDETFTVTISAPVNGTLGTTVGTGTIADDDATPTLSVSGVTVLEGDAGTTNAVFPVTLSAASGRTVTVSYATASNGSALAGSDYTAAGGLLTFAPGVVLQNVTVGVLGDLVPEPDETFIVGLSSPANATLGSSTATGTITDDDLRPKTVDDGYATDFETPLSVPAPGVLANDTSTGGAMTAVLVSDVSHGTLALGANGSVSYTPVDGFAGTDSFTYRADNPAGTGTTSTVTITVAEPTVVQPPKALRVSAIAGTSVTFRWEAPAIGPTPVGYLVEGGVLPSQTLASFETNLAAPIFTVTAPSGSFFVRVRALGPGGPSGVSNEIPVHVATPVAPSAPTALQGTISGDTLHLAWTPTFTGGAATSTVLDVTGSISASLPLPAVERISFAGVPAGTYTLTVRSVNAGGSSAPSAPLLVTVPGVCAGAPEPPRNVLAFVVGGTTFLVWDPPATGDAPTSYLVTVPGVGVLPTGQRALSGGLSPGTYPIEVRSVGACGNSLAAAVTLIVP